MKKRAAFFLALLICLLPVSAVAASPCDNGHTVSSTLHDPTYVDCIGGYKSTWYECTVCGQPCGTDRTAAVSTAVGVSSPRTADSSRVALWSAACVCSAARLLSITVKKKKYA